jgi:phage shock protein A
MNTEYLKEAVAEINKAIEYDNEERKRFTKMIDELQERLDPLKENIKRKREWDEHLKQQYNHRLSICKNSSALDRWMSNKYKDSLDRAREAIENLRKAEEEDQKDLDKRIEDLKKIRDGCEVRIHPMHIKKVMLYVSDYQ